MAKPPLVPWDSTLANLSAVTSGHQTAGLVTNEIPTSAEFNALYNNTYLWFAWLYATVATITKASNFRIVQATNWGPVSSYNAFTDAVAVACTGNGSAYFDLDVPVGYKLATLQFNAIGGGGTLFSALYETVPSASGTVTTQSIFESAVVLSASDTVYTFNLLSTSTTNAGGQTVTVAAAGGTYTRSAGSFITDGLYVGQQVQWTGFVNGGNNALKVITALTATVMTVSNTGLVNETGSANATIASGVSPIVDSTIAATQLKFTGTNGISAAKLRYTMIPQ